MVRSIFLFLLCTFSLSSYSMQVKPAKNNHKIKAIISSSQLSRIFVSKNRIVSVKGIKGTYLLVKDEKQGSIYIKPTSYFSKKPFDIFITTESGLTYDLFLMPKQIPSETIWIKPLNSSNKKAKRWEVNSSYSDKLVELIKEMQSESHPEGYAVIPVDGKVKKINGLKVQLLKVYRGFHLQGEVWCVMNDTRKPIKINLNDFKYNGLLALSMEDDYLKIGEEVYLYKVVSHG